MNLYVSVMSSDFLFFFFFFQAEDGIRDLIVTGVQTCALPISRSAFRMIPASYQPQLPLDRLVLPVGAPGAGDRMELDVVIVGAGPAGQIGRASCRERV